jgi:hypothetical protein
MTHATTTIFAIALLTSSFTSHAAQPKIGASVEGGKFLYREAVEVYWNDWIGFPIMTKTASETHQARVTVVGEGKTTTFIGNLSINCENGKHFWESAGSGSEFLSNEKQADEIVPLSAIRNAVKLFCKRA